MISYSKLSTSVWVARAPSVKAHLRLLLLIPVASAFSSALFQTTQVAQKQLRRIQCPSPPLHHDNVARTTVHSFVILLKRESPSLALSQPISRLQFPPYSPKVAAPRLWLEGVHRTNTPTDLLKLLTSSVHTPETPGPSFLALPEELEAPSGC